MRKLLITLLILSSNLLCSQVKIGQHPEQIDRHSVLELEGNDKALVITRMTTIEMNSISPLSGAMVYNTDENCVFAYNKPLNKWTSLCNSTSIYTGTTTPTAPKKGDMWVNNRGTQYWDGSKWVTLSKTILNGNGHPKANVPNPQTGDVYVDNITGDVYAFNPTSNTWVNQNKLNVQNGLTYDRGSQTVKLGGVLTEPTSISTSANNPLKIEGLQEGDITKDEVLTIDKTGELRKVNAEKILKQVEKVFVAKDEQLVFDLSSFELKTRDKVDVYRNGVRIDFTINNSKQITLEQEAKCYDGDRIRIVQFY